ncbi:MAG: hypothetical protein WC028_26230 [Candidatus Obscuribacterales bacterium]
MLIRTQDALIEWLESYNWFDCSEITDYLSTLLISSDTGKIPETVSFKLSFVSAGSLTAGQEQTIRSFLFQAIGVSEWRVNDAGACFEGMRTQGLEVDDESAKLRLIIDENIWLTCEELEIVEQPEQVVRVVPWLSDSMVSIIVGGEAKPTPVWWIERFTECGVNVAWRILGDVAVPPESVSKDDYTGWFLQEVDAIESTQHGLMVSFSQETSSSFHASFRWWNSNESTQARIWPALAQIVAGFKDCEVQCGNCKLTGTQWQQAVFEGQQYLATLYPGLSEALRCPTSLVCLLCSSEFVDSGIRNDFYGRYYCEPCRANRSHLFLTAPLPRGKSPSDFPERIRYDFEATIRFLPYEEGGPSTSYIPQQLYRPDFYYKGQLKDGFMIWPTFVADNGVPIERGALVDISKPVSAFMTIISDDLRVSEHQKRILPGVEFCFRYGSRIVAEGKVLRILELHSE